VIKSGRVRWTGHVRCGTYGERRVAEKDLVGKAEGRVLFRRRGRRWEDNIKVDLQAIGWGM